MFKIFLKITLFVFLLWSYSWVSAEETGWRTIDITVTEKIPGITCNQAVRQVSDRARDAIPIEWRYVCAVPIGFKWALAIMGALIRWFTGLAMLCAVLYIVFNGIHLSMWGLDGNAKWEVKKRIMMTLWGIILLLLSWPFLKILAPWVYK